MKEELIRQILAIEWPMFASVENEGGKASCQSRPKTFEIMRRSQYESWPEEVLEAWYEDLACAEKESRNLSAEKYAFMMEVTAPDVWPKIRKRLPQIEEGTIRKIREIVEINMCWQEETDRKYPQLRSNGRPLRSTQDTPFAVSVETYLFCELKTYSARTIDRLHTYTVACQKQGVNLAEKTLENTVKEYGYASLEEAVQSL